MREMEQRMEQARAEVQARHDAMLAELQVMNQPLPAGARLHIEVADIGEPFLINDQVIPRGGLVHQEPLFVDDLGGVHMHHANVFQRINVNGQQVVIQNGEIVQFNGDFADMDPALTQHLLANGIQIDQTQLGWRWQPFTFYARGGAASVDSRVRHRDSAYELVIEQTPIGRYLRAETRDGQTVYDGPLNTAVEIDSLPADLAETVRRLLDSMPSPPLVDPGMHLS